MEAVIPVAERAGVRLALHPNDPVSQQSHGSDQIMANLEGLKRLITLVDSPSNGITFDCGVMQQMGEDPVEVCRYFASRNRINHVHYRNVISEIKYDKYTEVFLDEGQVNMFAVMQELFKHKYKRGLYASTLSFWTMIKNIREAKKEVVQRQAVVGMPQSVLTSVLPGQ